MTDLGKRLTLAAEELGRLAFAATVAQHPEDRLALAQRGRVIAERLRAELWDGGAPIELIARESVHRYPCGCVGRAGGSVDPHTGRTEGRPELEPCRMHGARA